MAPRQAAILLCLLPAWPAAAASLNITVLDAAGEPLPDVVVVVETPGPAAPVPDDPQPAVMDQVDLRFEPHILVVRTGTPVEFPNSDTVAHHVYSFSHPNQFDLSMYKGVAHSPVLFDEAGVVSLGCNIHDNMLGYIVVVESPTFAKTDDHGRAVFDRPDGELRVRIWSPRIRDDNASLATTVTAGRNEVTFRLAQSLRPPHGRESGALSWDEY